MQREALRQRIQYLIEHGGTYPEQRPDWKGWAILAPLVFIAGVELVKLLR